MQQIDTITLGYAEQDNVRWKTIMETYLKTAKTFEIHCWLEEQEWIAFALQYGKDMQASWKYGKVIGGLVTLEFKNMLLHLPKPDDTEVYHKMIPFFSIFLDNGCSSEYYGTELHIVHSK